MDVLQPNRTACPDCDDAAYNWSHGGYRSGCHGCLVRSIASGPAVLREQFYARSHADEQLRAEVDAEIARVAELRLCESLSTLP